MKCLIFDTFAGLCNQFYDIFNAINFCLKYNIFFTFRYCSFRNDNQNSWNDQPFEKLFDLTFLKDYSLYIDYFTIKDSLTNENCYNLNEKYRSISVINDNINILEQLINFNKEYVVLRQFHASYKCRNIIDNRICNFIRPSKEIMEKYIEIKNKIIKDESYNSIHYRYEKDFTDHFKIQIENLDTIIQKIKFKNNNLNIYIATSNITKILDVNKYTNLIYKDDNDDILINLNYEQKAFIDYMFCINSLETYGHTQSSFSRMINNIKHTNNFYNK